MNRRIGIAILAVILLLTGPVLYGSDIAWGAGGRGQDRAKCGVLSEKEARVILDSLGLNEAKILKIQDSPVQNLWEVALENRGTPFLIYVDCSKKYVMPGPIIEHQTRIDKTRQRVEDLNRDKRVSLAGLRLDESLVMGSQDAPIKVVAFLDPD